MSAGLAGAEAWTRTPGGRLDEALDVLVGPGADEELLDALVGVVYPAMAVAYAEHVAVASGPADTAVRRVLRRVLADLDGLTADGSALAPARGRERAGAAGARAARRRARSVRPVGRADLRACRSRRRWPGGCGNPLTPSLH